MNSLIVGAAIFIMIVCAHLVSWRLINFKSPAKGLIIILAGVMTLSLFLLLREPLITVAYINLIFVSLTLAYLLTMPAIESDSPSSVILLHIERCGEKGCTIDDLQAIVTDDRFVGERIRGMVKQGLIRKSGTDYAITDSGRHFLRFFVFYHIAAGRAHVGG